MQNRTTVARYSAEALLSGNVSRKTLVLQLAAWLKESKNNRQAAYLIQDIAKKLAENGYLYVTVTTATAMTEQTKNSVTAFLNQHYGDDVTIELHEEVQPKIIGGVRIDTPHGSLDATVKRSLIQIIKGVQK